MCGAWLMAQKSMGGGGSLKWTAEKIGCQLVQHVTLSRWREFCCGPFRKAAMLIMLLSVKDDGLLWQHICGSTVYKRWV